MATASTALSAGDHIAGRYEIEKRLGEGGMAVVYQARHVGTDKPCALKFLLPQLAKADKHRDQFLKEARVAGLIGSHPHIVDVFDTGIDEQRKLPFIAMELLQGQTLCDFAASQGRVPWDTARVLLEQLGDALDSAHEAGVVHRDLKPTNVFVTQDRKGRPLVKVLDFGIAKVLEGTLGDRTATQVGTPWYSAPEQLGSSMRKLAAERGIVISMGVSPATDVWALGLVAFEMLCGIQPKEYWGSATMADQMIKVALEDRAPPSRRAGERAEHLPAGFDDWFLRCMRHNAEERFSSAGEAVDALSALLAPEPLTVRAPAAADGAGEALAALDPASVEHATTPIGRQSPLAELLPRAAPATSQPAYPTPAEPPGPALPPSQPAPLPTPLASSAPAAGALGTPGASAPATWPGAPPTAAPALMPTPARSPDTASSWQEVAPARPAGTRAAWVIAGGAVLALGIGATIAVLSVQPGRGETHPDGHPAKADTAEGSASAAAMDSSDAPAAESAPTPEGIGAAGEASRPSATASATVAAALEAPSATAPSARPEIDDASAPARPPTATGTGRTQPKGKGFDDLFGTR